MSEVDNGGLDNMSTAKLMLVELIYRDTGFLDKSDRRIFRILRDDPELKNNPVALAKLYQYRTTLVTCLTKNLQLLGIERCPISPRHWTNCSTSSHMISNRATVASPWRFNSSLFDLATSQEAVVLHLVLMDLADWVARAVAMVLMAVAAVRVGYLGNPQTLEQKQRGWLPTARRFFSS